MRFEVVALILVCLVAAGQGFSDLKALKGNYSEFSGKVAFVTGGSSGMGFSVSMTLAQLGSNVVFICRDHHPTWYNGTWAQDKINSDPVVQQAKGSALFVKADFTDIKSIRSALDVAFQRYSRIDYFANVGGNAGWIKRTDEITQDDLFGAEDAIKNNLYGTINLLIAQTQFLRDHGDPEATYSIVLMSSYNGLRGCENGGLYTASKWGINGLAKSVAMEFLNTKPKVRVNSIAAGLPSTSLTWQQAKLLEWGKQVWEEPYVTPESDLWKKWEPTFRESLVGQRIADVQEITNVVVYLLSKASGHINGQVITVDNAQTAM